MQIWVIFRYIEFFEKQNIEDFKSILLLKKSFLIIYEHLCHIFI